MSEWNRISKMLPQEGKIVDIKIIGGTIIRNVQFEMGRFWKKRIGKNAGMAWSATDWAYPEKVKKADSIKAKDIIGTGPLPEKISTAKIEGKDETADNQEK